MTNDLKDARLMGFERDSGNFAPFNNIFEIVHFDRHRMLCTVDPRHVQGNFVPFIDRDRSWQPRVGFDFPLSFFIGRFQPYPPPAGNAALGNGSFSTVVDPLGSIAAM